MADSSPYNYSYTPLRSVDEEDEPCLLQSPPGQASYQQPPSLQPQPPSQTGLHYSTQPCPTVNQTQTRSLTVNTQQTTDTKFPKYAFVTSMVATMIVTVLFWIPGLLCLVPATVMSIVALSKKDDNKLKEAKELSIASFILVLIFAISYPILVVTVILASVFGYMCNSNSYYRPSYCAGGRYY